MDRAGKKPAGLGADIHPHPALGDSVGGNGFCAGLRRKGVRNHIIDRQKQGDPLLPRLFEQGPRDVELLRLADRGADFTTLCLKKGIGHAAADQDAVGLVEQAFDDADLVRDLRAAKDRNKGALRGIERAAHDLQLLFDQEAADRGFQVVGHPGRRAVGAVRGAECVVDKEIGQGGKLLRKLGVVFRLSLLEADVLKQQHLARLEGGGARGGVRPDHIGGKSHRHAEQLGEADGNRLHRKFFLRAVLRAAEMGAEDDRRSVREQITDGWQRRDNPLVVGDDPVGKRNVKIAAHQSLFPVESDILNRFFVVGWHENSSLDCRNCRK